MQQSASYVNIKHLMFLEWMNDKFGGMQDGLGRKSGSREKIRTTQHFWNELFIYLDSRQRELPPASQHPAAGAVNCVDGHLCFTSIYSVPLLARRALRYQRRLRRVSGGSEKTFTTLQLTKGFTGLFHLWTERETSRAKLWYQYTQNSSWPTP